MERRNVPQGNSRPNHSNDGPSRNGSPRVRRSSRSGDVSDGTRETAGASTFGESRTTARWMLVTLVAAAAGFAIVLSAPAASAKAPGALIETKKLDNGLQVISIPDRSLPIVTVEMAVRHGAFAETPEFDGLSHLYEHMFFKANSEIPNQEKYLRRMKELGIVFNGSTSTERVNYFYTLPRRNLEGGLELLNHSIRSPVFNEKEFEKEKKVVLSEYDRAVSHPQYAFDRKLQRELWYEYPSRKIILGSREAINTATIDQMKKIKKRYYVPNNAALVVSGDVAPEKVFSMAESIFGDWESGPNPFMKNEVPKHPALKQRKFLVHEGAVKVPSIDFRWQGPSVDEDPEATYAADVASFILSQDSSKFQQALVDSKVAHQAGLSYYTQKHTGPITASAQVPAKNIEKAVETLIRELHKLDDPDYYSDQQLENAKSILEARDVYGREKASSFAHTVSFWWAVDDVEYYSNYVDNLKKVTREDITDYVSEYILGEPFVAGVVLSGDAKKRLEFDEKKLEAIVTRVEEEIANESSSDGSSDTGEDAS